MFDALSTRLDAVFNRLRARGSLREPDVDEALKDIRLALLEADVNFKVTKDFCTRVRHKALGKAVLKSLSPGEMVVKIVYEELVQAMGEHVPLGLGFAPPVIIMLVGLQGSGKTTSCGKLARYLHDELKRRPLLVSLDVYRPAAREQLKILGQQLNIAYFDSSQRNKPLEIALDALEHAKKASFDTILLDTAGRLQIDEEMMDELVELAQALEPQEILLVADAMTGQEAVNVAKGFDERLDIDGLVLSKLDGDSRGGAALSMRAVTGKPIKFVGLGEKLDALDVFHPARMASRILGMGDVLTLIEKASKQVSFEESKKLQKKIKKDDFTLDDFYSQLQSMKKLGSLGSLAQMIPGVNKLMRGFNEEIAEKEVKRIEAIILSMTPQERKNASIMDGSRRQRIAKGSGTSVEQVNKLLKQFGDMKKIMKKFMKGGPASMSGITGLLGNLKNPGMIR